jgi:predicted nucleic-acid-binding Zn-ribbon protein
MEANWVTIAYEDLLRFVSAHGSNNYQCTFCGHHSFTFNGGEDIAGLTNVPVEARLPFVDHRPNAPPGSLNMYSIVCQNCGRTDFFHVNQIVAWLAKNPR